jgi:DNA-binding response OmpR family regulator
MKKILIVDDDEAILEALKAVMEMSGYDVEITTDGQEVEAIVHNQHIDLILLDLLLSGSDGSEITKSLRESGIGKKIPIIILSAHPNAKESAIQCGANDFIAKPFDLSDIVTVVEKYCTYNSTQDDNPIRTSKVMRRNR